MAIPEELSRDELIALVRKQAGKIGALTAQVADLVTANEALVRANEALADRLARVEHLLSRNSGNSSMPPSGDDGPGKTPPKKKTGGPGRSRGKQPGARGTHLAWSDEPDERQNRFPQGRCRARVPHSEEALLAAVSPTGQLPRGADRAFSAADLLRSWQ
ncbi:MAG: DUF6444 domain-containing protein [Intrasporangium sp.]|uniref:DUF6444 domain-containing protein n=1 Tax=Intrasporangium sp. TaxID=1925024 RepID=UPI00264928E3|nr:DUF6444 domain-containing protein [Intrasporangium sp.]MDN5796974.1 DUF6444 domain-containing protein [Intrasporangium sp.]